jgi:flavin-dependent dehydrogenase
VDGDHLEDPKSGLYRSNLFAPANEEPKTSTNGVDASEERARLGLFIRWREEIGTVQPGFGVFQPVGELGGYMTETSTNGVDASEETVRARYMVGCDGARSWVRKYATFDFRIRPVWSRAGAS